MEDPIKQLFIVELAQSEKKLATPLAYEEINALQYTAGYIIQALQQKIERSAHLLVEKNLSCVWLRWKPQTVTHFSMIICRSTSAASFSQLVETTDQQNSTSSFLLIFSIAFSFIPNSSDAHPLRSCCRSSNYIDRNNIHVMLLMCFNPPLSVVLVHTSDSCSDTSFSSHLPASFWRSTNKKIVQKFKGIRIRKNLLPKSNSKSKE